jgi:methionine biosynthesis protein MetW
MQEEEKYIHMSNLRNRLIAIQKLLGRFECERILDIGCGTGIIGASLLKNHGCEVYGLDNDEKALRLAAKRGLAVKMLDIEKENFPYPSEFFNVVIFSEVIEHITEYHHVLDEVYRVLEKNGVLILSTPNLNSGANILKIVAGEDVIPIYDRECQDRHVRLFSLKSIRTLLTIHGFKIDKVNYVDYPPSSCLGLLHRLLWFIFPRLGAFIIIKA